MRRTLLAASLALALTGCATRSINALLAEPSRYANRDVTVGGTVTQSVSLLGHGAYQIDDGTGTLWVVS
ncbi:MAG TPA: lipoprotein, partial [Actinomycetota bacterium]|nr:lipoprotein [Actinomycetota bacterium]